MMSYILYSIAVLFLLASVWVGHEIISIDHSYNLMKDSNSSSETLSHIHDFAANIYESANLILLEANSLIDSDSIGWKSEINSTHLKVMSKSITGNMEEHSVPLQRAQFTFKSRLSSRDIMQRMTNNAAIKLFDPTVTKDSAALTPLVSYDWFKGRIELCYSYVALPWPLHNREFTQFNVVDEEEMTFVSVSVPLSETQRHLIPPQYRPDSGYHRKAAEVRTASKYFALKIQLLKKEKVIPYAPDPDVASDLSQSSERVSANQPLLPVFEYHYRFHMLALTAGVLPSAALTYYLNSKLYFPMIARNILKSVGVTPVKKKQFDKV